MIYKGKKFSYVVNYDNWYLNKNVENSVCGQSNEKQNEYFSRKRRVDVKIVEKQPILLSCILYHFLLGVVLVLGWQFSQISSHDSVTAPTTFFRVTKSVTSCEL